MVFTLGPGDRGGGREEGEGRKEGKGKYEIGRDGGREGRREKGGIKERKGRIKN